MRFINGLKSLSKKTLLLVILILFIISWVLVLLGTTIITIPGFVIFVGGFAALLTGFTFVVMIVSFFIPIDKMGSIVLIIIGLLTIPILIIFAFFIHTFRQFCHFANILFIAFFAYKWCMDSSKKFDNYLYKKDSKVFLRILEFFIFLAISIFTLLITIRIFRILAITRPAMSIAAFIFFVILLIDLILLMFVLLRLIFIQKLSAYIPLFGFLTYFYILYVVIDLFAAIIFAGTGVTSYEYISFAIDLIMFIYIVGSIFDRVDYIKDTIKIFRVDTIALFVILMKMLVKLFEILLGFTVVLELREQIAQAIIVLIYFGFFAVFLGIYSIISHKEGKAVK